MHTHDHNHSDEHGHEHEHNHVYSHNHAHNHDHNHGHDHGHCHGEHCHDHHDSGHESFISSYRNELISLILLIAGVIINHCHLLPEVWQQVVFFVVAVLPVGFPILGEAWENWRHGRFMNEFTLMIAATAGAFIIGEYPEGVAVLLFYSIGEKLEDSASDDVRKRIRNLIGKLPEKATVITPEGHVEMHPKDVTPDSKIFVAPGEKVALDSRLEGDEDIDFDTAAITGESVPRSFSPGSDVAAGCIPVDKAATLVTTREFKDSSMSRIMQMIESASSNKAPTETLLSKITRWYTPVVFILALLLFVTPWIVSLINGSVFEWEKWFERSLVFLVCSCPCALVVSIPLTYFASLGRASRLGVLFKGSGYVDKMRDIDTVIFDKTGTLTTGDFHVSSIVAADGVKPDFLLSLAASVDEGSAHPLAKAVCAEAKRLNLHTSGIEDVKSISHGMSAKYEDKTLLVGSRHLMKSDNISVPATDSDATEICVALDGKYLGSIFLLDNVKPEAAAAIRRLHELGVKNVAVLSGDHPAAVKRIADMVGADSWKAELLPADKQSLIMEMEKNGDNVAFVGDGANDAPAIAASSVGMAMGTMGSDIAMESADALIAGDDISKIPAAISLSKKVKRVVVENVSFALGVKALVMILGAFGIATLWAAVFADTGVTLLTVIWTIICFSRKVR